MKRSSQSAFSLYELLVALALVSIGTSIAIPSLAALQQKSEREALRNHLHASLHHARRVQYCVSSIRSLPHIHSAACQKAWCRSLVLHAGKRYFGRYDEVEQRLDGKQLVEAASRWRHHLLQPE